MAKVEICPRCHKSDKVSCETRAANKGKNFVKYCYCDRCRYGWSETVE